MNDKPKMRERLLAIKNDIELPENFDIVVGQKDASWYLQIRCYRPDTFTKEMGWGAGGKYTVSEFATTDEIVQGVFGLFKGYQEHECRENFLWRGRRIFGPHISLDALWSVCEQLSVREPMSDTGEKEALYNLPPVGTPEEERTQAQHYSAGIVNLEEEWLKLTPEERDDIRAKAVFIEAPLEPVKLPESQCLLPGDHEAHPWVYTSSGGGHMLEYPITEEMTRTEKNLKAWWCRGLAGEEAPGLKEYVASEIEKSTGNKVRPEDINLGAMPRDPESREAILAGYRAFREEQSAETDEAKYAPDIVRAILQLTQVDVPLEEIEHWPFEARKQAGDWAGAVHLQASDNDVEVPERPEFLDRRVSPQVFIERDEEHSESLAAWTDRLTHAGRKAGINRQCSIGYHNECSDPDGNSCTCFCHALVLWEQVDQAAENENRVTEDKTGFSVDVRFEAISREAAVVMMRAAADRLEAFESEEFTVRDPDSGAPMGTAKVTEG